METSNLKLKGLFFLLFCALFSNVFSQDIILRKGPGDPGSVTRSSLFTTSSVLTELSHSDESVLPVTADIYNAELGVYFSSPVGTALISIEDQFGNVIYQTTLDTYNKSELFIPVDTLDAGDYTLRISYGTTRLVGEFQL